jgi:hypothetical protein
MWQNYRFLIGLIVGWISIILSELLWSQSQLLEQLVPWDNLDTTGQFKSVSNMKDTLLTKVEGPETDKVSSTARQAGIRMDTTTHTKILTIINKNVKNVDSGTSRPKSIKDFKRYPNVVIATKIHGPVHVKLLAQSLCLLHAAYNTRVLHDILVFTTIPLNNEDIRALEEIVHPASLTVVPDKKTLQDHIADMTPAQRRKLLKRCFDANTTQDLTWGHRCTDGPHNSPLAYTWMSEFRTKHIWKHEALASYKYMVWWDSDNFAMNVWDKDPVAFMIRRNLVLLMANFGQGTTKGFWGVQKKVQLVYNKTLCSSEVALDGRLTVQYGGDECINGGVRQVHGFFHITDLDFYRLPQNLHWFDVEIGDNKFSRIWDDQLAVIVPASMLAPNRTMEMGKAGLDLLKVMHNKQIMGQGAYSRGGFLHYFRTGGGKELFPSCKRLVSKST